MTEPVYMNQFSNNQIFSRYPTEVNNLQNTVSQNTGLYTENLDGLFTEDKEMYPQNSTVSCDNLGFNDMDYTVPNQSFGQGYFDNQNHDYPSVDLIDQRKEPLYHDDLSHLFSKKSQAYHEVQHQGTPVDIPKSSNNMMIDNQFFPEKDIYPTSWDDLSGMWNPFEHFYTEYDDDVEMDNNNHEDDDVELNYLFDEQYSSDDMQTFSF